MEQNFKLLVCFTKSHDIHHELNLHLIASTAVVVDGDASRNMTVSMLNNEFFFRNNVLVIEVFTEDAHLFKYDTTDTFGLVAKRNNH